MLVITKLAPMLRDKAVLGVKKDVRKMKAVSFTFTQLKMVIGVIIIRHVMNIVFLGKWEQLLGNQVCNFKIYLEQLFL